MTSHIAHPAPQPKVQAPPRHAGASTAAGLGIGIGVALVTLAWSATRIMGVDLLVANAGATHQAVTLATVAGMTVAGGLVGWLLSAATRRWTRRPRRTFVAICVVALVAYAGVPFQAAATVETALWLNAFHVLVALPVVGLLARSLPTSRP